jgi:RNA polymerase sigma-70 factor (ECF subfamily)
MTMIEEPGRPTLSPTAAWQPRATDPAKAVASLLDRYGAKLYRLARRLCGNESDAEDLVQDVFLQVFRKWGAFRGDSSPGTWLYAIAARSCKAGLRRRGGIDRRMPALSQFPERPERSSTLAHGSSPLDDAVEHESVDAIHAAVVSLPEHFRLPLIFKEVLGLSVEQTAEALKLKPQTVKSRLHRARLLLRGAVESRRRQRVSPPARLDDQACHELLNAKLDAMDEGRPFPEDPRGVCSRCLSACSDLDLAQRACVAMARGSLPPRVRANVLRLLASSTTRSRPARPKARSC